MYPLIHFVQAQFSSIYSHRRQRGLHKCRGWNGRQEEAKLCAPAWRSRPRGGHGAASAVAVLFEGGVEGPADDEPAHLAGAGPDLIELGVAQEAPHGVVIDVTVPTCHTKNATSHSLSPISGLRVGKQRETLLHCAGLCPAVRDSPRHWIPSRAT